MKKLIFNITLQPLIQSLFFYYFIYCFSGKTSEFREYFIIIPLVATYFIIKLFIKSFGSKEKIIRVHKSFYFLFFPISILASLMFFVGVILNSSGLLKQLNTSNKVIIISFFTLILLNILIEIIYLKFISKKNYYGMLIPKKTIDILTSSFSFIIPETSQKVKSLNTENNKKNK